MWNKKTCGTLGIIGILTLMKVPKVSIMSPCVIKNGALIFKEKGSRNQFLRTFWGGWKCVRRKSVETENWKVKTENWKVCAKSANSAIYAQILEIVQFAQSAEIASDKSKNWKRKGENGKLKTENGKGKSENWKVKTERWKGKGEKWKVRETLQSLRDSSHTNRGGERNNIVITY